MPEPAVDLRPKAHILDARITAARKETSTLAELDPKITTLTTWRDHLIAWRETLCTELLGCPQRPRTDHDAGVLQNLQLSIMTVDRGRGVFDGSGYALVTLRLGALIRESTDHAPSHTPTSMGEMGSPRCQRWTFLAAGVTPA